MDRRIFRFKHCDERFYPYIDKVLKRVPSEVKEKILNDTSFEIIGSLDHINAAGMFIEFENSIKDIVYLNSSLIESAEDSISIRHLIAHEFAHYIAKQGQQTHLYEKEAEELLIEWGFDKESNHARYNRPILETKGFKVGHEWAKLQDESKLEILERFYQEWANYKLSKNRYNELAYEIDPGSIIEEMSEFIEKEFADIKEIHIDDSFTKGIMWGVMNYFDKIIRKKEANLVERHKDQSELIDLLEIISNYLNRLYSLEYFQEKFFELATDLDIPTLSVNIDELLDHVRDAVDKNY